MKPQRFRLFLICLLVPAVHASVHAQAARAPARPSGSAPVVIHTTPGGDTLAVLPEGAQVQAIGRQGEWTRVRVEGWTRSPVAGAATAASLSPSALRAAPDAHRGARVTWRARFLALQRADPVRTDFTPGELYVLARDPNNEPGFVYIALTPQQALVVKRFQPLQPFTFVGRVRTGASPLMGHPVLELVEIRS